MSALFRPPLEGEDQVHAPAGLDGRTELEEHQVPPAGVKASVSPSRTGMRAIGRIDVMLAVLHRLVHLDPARLRRVDRDERPFVALDAKREIAGGRPARGRRQGGRWRRAPAVPALAGPPQPAQRRAGRPGSGRVFRMARALGGARFLSQRNRLLYRLANTPARRLSKRARGQQLLILRGTRGRTWQE